MNKIKDSKQSSNCFVYRRRSQDREDRQSLSIDKQDRQVEQIFEQNFSLHPIYLPPEDKSAKVPGRPIFDDMMKRIENGEAQHIAVWITSRLSRNPVDAATVIFAMDRGKLLTVRTPTRVYKNNPEDKYMLQIELANDKKNNDNLSIYVKEGFEVKRLHGQYPGPAPLGYINAIIGPGERNIVHDPERAPKVIQICELAATGIYQIDDLMKEAHKIGLTSRSGKLIAKQTLIDMLQRRANTGAFKYNKSNEWHQGTYKPLISVELYDKIQVAMGWVKPRRRDKPNTTTGRYYPYKGLFMCETCKFNVTAYTKPRTLASGKEAEYIFYTCTKKNKKIKCKEPQLSGGLLEQQIKSTMQQYEISEEDGAECSDWLDKHYNDYIKKTHQNRPQWLKDAREARKALEVLDEKLEKGVMTDERYKERSTIHAETLARTKRHLSDTDTDAEAWLELAKEVFSNVTNIGDVFDIANDEERRRLMMYVGSNWHLGNKKVVLTPREPLSMLCQSTQNPNWRARPDSA